MAIKGTLKIDGCSETFTLQECEYRLSQTVSVDGIPTSGVCGGLIIATIVTPTKGFVLYEWMLNDFMKKDGTISFVININDKSKKGTRTIRFEEAFCTNLFEYYNGLDKTMMTTRIAINARKIMFGDNTGQGIGLDNQTKKVIEGSVQAVDVLKQKAKSAAGETLQLLDFNY